MIASALQQKSKLKMTGLLPAVSIGLFAFWSTVGFGVINPTDISWIPYGGPSGDSLTHYLGWAFFRDSPWSWPPGVNPRYGLELSSSIVFSDSIPLFALVFKVLASVLPQPFQYFGLWLLACFLLQAWFAWQLARSFCPDSMVAKFCVTGCIVFSTTMTLRLNGHFALVGQWTIIAALWLGTMKPGRLHLWRWIILTSVSSLIHLYLFAMVMALGIADLIRLWYFRAWPVGRLSWQGGLMVASPLLMMYLAGAFMIHSSGLVCSDYGNYAFPLSAPFDPNNDSMFLSDLPGNPGQEGYAYLGFGALLMLPAAFSRRKNYLAPDIVHSQQANCLEYLPLLFAVIGMAIFAVSNQVKIFNSVVVTVPLPDLLVRAFSIFHGSGRFWLPSHYLLILFAVVGAYRFLAEKKKSGLLLCFLLLQIVDTHPLRQAVVSSWHPPQFYSDSARFSSSFWKEAAQQYKEVRVIPAGNVSPFWDQVAVLAHRLNLPTDSVYLARVDPKAMEGLHIVNGEMLRTGFFPRDKLFVLQSTQIAREIFLNKKAQDFLGIVDGLVVLAPGWLTSTTHQLLMHGERQINFEELYNAQ